MDTPSFLSTQVTASRRFHLDLRPDPRTPLAVVSAGWEACARDYRMERAGFPYLGIEIVAHGRGVLELGGRTEPIAAGAVFAYGPRVPHRIRSGSPPLRKYFLDLSGSDAARLLADAGLAPGALRCLADPTPALAQLDALIGVGMRSAPATAGICAQMATAFLLVLARDALETRELASPAHATWRRCHQAIEEGDGRLRTVAAVAELIGVSPEHVSRLYQRYAAMTVSEHLRQVRLRRAPDLLRDGRLRVADVARLLGFADAFHFSKAFRRQFHLPPSQVRAMG